MIITPVLFLGFNRPDLARVVLLRLQECGVKRLYVALDGPRSGNKRDRELCNSMKSLIDAIDWADEKIILERSENLGCGRAVCSAISWFFEHVDSGIIVEDDCLPDSSFFEFCEEMLIRHENNQDVWSVAGSSLISDLIESGHSHFFSKYSGIWGWATWRRAWETYSYDMSICSTEEWKEIITDNCCNAVERQYWLHILEMMLRGKIDTWDFQLQFSAWKQNALHVTSSKNLVENLGFREDATHTTENSPLAARKTTVNQPPYEVLPVRQSEFLDRIIFSEKLHASNELAEWLYGKSNLVELTKTTEAQKKYIEELEDHLAKRGVIIDALESARLSHLQDLEMLKNDMKSYSGLSGALKCLKKIGK